ncbi:hypothetical protein C0J52_02518, partial [Blattella germanica]
GITYRFSSEINICHKTFPVNDFLFVIGQNNFSLYNSIIARLDMKPSCEITSLLSQHSRFMLW